MGCTLASTRVGPPVQYGPVAGRLQVAAHGADGGRADRELIGDLAVTALRRLLDLLGHQAPALVPGEVAPYQIDGPDMGALLGLGQTGPDGPGIVGHLDV